MKSTGLAIALPPETHRKGRTHQYNNGTDALKAFKRRYKSSTEKAFIEAFSADIDHYLTLKEQRFNLYRVGAFRYLYIRCVALHGTDPEFTNKLDTSFMTVLKKNSLL